MRRAVGLLLAFAMLAGPLAGCLGSTDDPVDPTARDGDAVEFTNTSVYPGDYQTDGDHARVLEEGSYDRLPDEVTDIPNPVDEGTVRVGVVRPDVPEGEQVPVIAVLGDFYDQDYQQATLEEGSLHEMIARLITAEFLVENFVSHGYAVALVAWPGASGSDGCWDPLSPNEAAALDHAVTWLGEQAWSNGNVGTIGGSASGGSQWAVAGEDNPHLETVVPVASVIDRFSMIFRNGTGYTPDTAYYALRAPFAPLGLVGHAERVATCGEEEAVDWEAALTWGYATGERGPDDHWEVRDQRSRALENYDGSVLLVTGFQDSDIAYTLYDWIDAFEDRGGEVKHLLGQWEHLPPDWFTDTEYNPTPRWDYAEILLNWFDRWLKEDTSVDLGPRVQVADSQQQWRNEEAWPPEDAEPTELFLSGQDALVREDPEEADIPLPPEATTWALDVACQSCATFQTKPVEEELRFAGLPRLHVSVTPAGPQGVLGAQLIVIDEGEAQQVTTSRMDLRFAAGGEEAQPVVPGETITARMQFTPVDAVVPEGASLAVVIGQAAPEDNWDEPLVDPVKDPHGHPPASPVVLHTGEDSTLDLLTFERGEDAFFEPPGVGG